MSNILEALRWRYATKQFDSEKKLTEEQLNVLLETLRLSASSYGLQPWKFIVVSNPEVRVQLQAAAFGQAQIVDASHLIVLAVRKTIDGKLVDEHIQNIVKVRNVSRDSLADYRARMLGSFQGKTPDMLQDWASRQVYLALGTLLTVAAIEGIDVCPMEGFDSARFDTILGLEKFDAQSLVLAPVGFRSEKDVFGQAPKVRFAKEDVIVEVK